jgi:hypothetical protein
MIGKVDSRESLNDNSQLHKMWALFSDKQQLRIIALNLTGNT